VRGGAIVGDYGANLSNSTQRGPPIGVQF
jgi:hypothetical protein